MQTQRTPLADNRRCKICGTVIRRGSAENFAKMCYICLEEKGKDDINPPMYSFSNVKDR